MEPFRREYSKLKHLPKGSEILNKQTKPKLVESLMFALTAFQLVDSYMRKQSDTIWKSMAELMKQPELTRKLIANKKAETNF